MTTLDGLLACAGTWHGTSSLQDPTAGVAADSPSLATVTPVLGGRFVRLDYTWSYQGKPQEGSLLIGFEKKADKVTMHWIDGWHNGDKVMVCTGPGPTSSPTLSALGSYAAPPGPDWGWRIEVTPEAGQGFRIVMYNLWPDGSREELAVEASYTRA